jgi:isochorismate pyruvate lyase
MNLNIVSPADCRTMSEVRAGVDRLDRALVELIAERFRYMDAAARIKPERGTVRDETRKAQVIANVAAHAAELGVPVAAARDLWEHLVEASIAYEFDRFDEMRAPQG